MLSGEIALKIIIIIIILFGIEFAVIINLLNGTIFMFVFMEM